MHRFLIALALVLAGPLAVAATPSTSLLPPRVERAINARVANGEYPAILVGVVDGAQSHVYAFGKLADGKAPDANTMFQIGSVTKTFTGALLAEAVQDGKLKLDTPVAALLPGFSIPSRGNKAITLGELAMQDSGLPRLPGNLDVADTRDPYAHYDAAELKAFLATYHLPRDPGAAYEYSNLGVGLLGYALARQAGMSYADLVKTRIFAPLGMTASSVTFSEPLNAHWAMGHDLAGQRTPPWHLGVLAGAGAINSDAADMLRYLEANLGHGPAQLVAAMRLAHAPRRNAIGNDSVGLLWLTRHDKDGDVVWHNGETGGYASFIGFVAGTQRGVVILTNIAQSVNDLGFATLLPDAPLAPAERRITMSPQQLDAYVGQYQLAPGFIVHVFRGKDGLLAQATGQGANPIVPSAMDTFFIPGADIQIDFKRGKRGAVTSLVLHQNGHAVPAPKMNAAAIEKAIGHSAIHLDKATLRQYVGRYQLTPEAVFDITLQGTQLMAQLTGQPAFPVYASAKDAFYYTIVNAQLSFQRNAQGRVDALIMHQNGANQRAPRIP